MKQLFVCLNLMLFCVITVTLPSNLAGEIEEFDKAEFFRERLSRLPILTGRADDPPPQPVIAVAEWEPSTGVLISYPLWIPIELVAEMAEDVEVMSVVRSEVQMNQALEDYINAGVDTSNCTFLITGSPPGPWTRDHGPWYIFDGDDVQGIINNNYFGPDDLVPQILGDSLGIPVYSTDLTTEGGNYQTDGMGTAIVTEWIHLENQNMTPEEIDNLMYDFVGIDNHIVRPVSPTHYHVDTFAKLLDPGRILVITPDPPDSNVEANVQFFKTLMSSYGRRYEVVRVQGRGYSNTLFLNNKVLVPMFDDPTDSSALETFREAMPGYEVQGFYHPGFSYGDALHCRTHEMADRYMLRIVHVPLHDRENTGGDYLLEADLHPYSDLPLVFGTPEIYWKVGGSSYNLVTMTHVGGDVYRGSIPQQPDGSDVYYYIHAEDESGRSENHPYIGPGNPHHFHVGPDFIPPKVKFNPPDTLFLPGGSDLSSSPAPVAYALDNRWISTVTLEFSINGIPQDDVEMTLIEPYAVYYRGKPEGIRLVPGDIIEARVKAVDTSVNQNTTHTPYYTVYVAGD
jgi:agmatine/peptidylarginine deiminase